MENNDKFLETIYKRKTIRSYTGKDISENELNEILKSANASPVGMGQYENVHLTVIKDKELLEKIDMAGARMFNKPNSHPLYGVPTFILVSSKDLGANMANVAYSNCAIIAHNMALTATALGVGACYIWGATVALSKDEEILRKLNLPEGFFPCCGLGLGKTKETYSIRDIPMDRIKTEYIG